MKRLLWLLLLLSTLAVAQTQQTVTGLVTSTTGVPASKGTVQFDISPYSSAVNYTVPGATVLSPVTQVKCGIDATGHIKSLADLNSPCLVWANDVISPANTTYTITLFPNNVQTQVIRQVCLKGAGPTDLVDVEFCPIVNVTPQYNSLNVPPVSADILPNIDGFFHLGVPGRGFYSGTITADPVFDTDIANKKYVDTHGGGGGGGMQDPGGNGIVKRTSFNITAPAGAADILGLFTGGCDITKVVYGDGVCRTPAGGVNTGTANFLSYYVDSTHVGTASEIFRTSFGQYKYVAQSGTAGFTYWSFVPFDTAGVMMRGRNPSDSTDLWSLFNDGTVFGTKIFTNTVMAFVLTASCATPGGGLGHFCAPSSTQRPSWAANGGAYTNLLLASDFTGNATKVVSASAPGTVGHFTAWDANGNVNDSGFTSNSFMTNPMTTISDMIVAGVGGTPTRVPTSASKCWTTDAGGVPGWNACPISGATTALDNLASTALNVDLLPGADNARALGSATKRYANAHVFQVTFYGATSGSCGLTATATGTGLVNTCSLAGPMNWTAIADPGSPADGDEWYSSTTANRKKFRAGGTTQTFAWTSDIPTTTTTAASGASAADQVVVSAAADRTVKYVSLAPVTLTDGATITWAIGNVNAQNATVTLGGNRTLNITGPVTGGTYLLRVVQDGTGSRTLTLGTGCTWKVVSGGSGALSLSTAINSIDILTFYYDGTNCYANLGKNYN